MKIYDYLIIGQGIAGSCLARCLLKQGKNILVLDKNPPTSSSRISAGIINPITGKKFVKTWKAEELLKYAQEFYLDFEKETRQSVYREMLIYRLFKNEEHRKHWLSKYDETEVGEYVAEWDVKLYQRYLKNSFGGFLLKGAVVDIAVFLEELRKQWQEQGIYCETDINYDELKIEAGELQWRDVKASNIILAEGWNAQQNPWFSWLPFNPVKGELLTISAPELELDLLVNRGLFVLPLGDHLYRIGATYTWDDLDEIPTTEGRNSLEQELGALIKKPFTVIDHQAGVRPATHDRRPFIGAHPVFSNVYIFNGMGTKGVSLAPFFANQFVNHLEGKEQLDAEADIARFYPLFPENQ